MADPFEAQVIEKLRQRATRREFGGVEVSYRVSGGVQGEQPVDEELFLTGPDRARARVRTGAPVGQEAWKSLSASEMTDLLFEVSEGLGELIPRSEARFVPDSVVGQVSVRVDGQEATFFFLPDPEQARQHGKNLVPSQTLRSVNALERLRVKMLPR